MNNAGETVPGGNGAHDDGWFVPFRVFFDRSFEHSFSAAIELCGGDEARAAQLCAQAFGRAYSRWALLGRVGDAEALISRRLRRGLRNLPDAPPLREAGVGYKPWVYVTATESGTSRKRARWLLSGAAAAACAILLAVSAVNSSPDQSDVSISGEPPRPTPPSSTGDFGTPPTSSSPPRGLGLDLDLLEEDETETNGIDDTDAEWSGFTLNLDDLPKSPSEIDALSPAVQPPTTVRPGTAPAGPPDTLPPTIAPPASFPPTTLPPTTLPPTSPPLTTLPPTTAPPTTSTTTTAAPATTTSTVAPTATTTSVAPPTDRDSKVEERERASQERENEREERKREREEGKGSD